VWSNHDTSKKNAGDIMRQPFLDFARGYMRYQHAFRPTKVVGFRLSALRALERALIEIIGEAKVWKSDAAIFNRAAQLINEKFERATSYRIGNQLEMVGEFLTANFLVEVGFDWKNFISRPYDKNRVGKKADDRRAKLLPSEAALNAIARAFVIATDAVDILVSSLMAIMFSIPVRINEVLRTPVNCEVTRMKKDGTDAYGLRWWPSKGADPTVNWVMPLMHEVIKKAIAQVKEQTDEARKMALWYEKHPCQIYLPNKLSYLRNQELLSLSEIAEIIGLASYQFARPFVRAKKLKMVKCEEAYRFRFEDFEKAIISLLPRGFPIFDRQTGLKYSEALFLVPRNFFHQTRATYRCMFEAIDTNSINNQLGAGLNIGHSSMFDRLGLTEHDGRPIRITTHQIRHFLNTLAQREGLSQLDIAKWSGRKDVRQNADYDHMTSDEIIKMFRSLDDSMMISPLAELAAKTPISRDEFLQLKFPTVHLTDIGFCIHDWTMMPCQRFRDCINCSEHVCIKGDTKKTERIKQQLHDAEEQLRRAEAADPDDVGIDKWLEHHRVAVQRLRSLVSILDDSSVPIGAIVQLSINKEFTQIGTALENRIRLGGKEDKLLKALLSTRTLQGANLLTLAE
jgi:hypothetical protein